MKLAFYIAEHGEILDRFIGLLTLGSYSHVEIVFDDDWWFSASTRDGGTRFKKIVGGTHWDYLPIKCDSGQEAAIYNWCKNHVGISYDYIGALGLCVGINMSSNTKWYCSRIVANVLLQYDLIDINSDRVSPNGLHGIVAAKLVRSGKWS